MLKKNEFPNLAMQLKKHGAYHLFRFNAFHSKDAFYNWSELTTKYKPYISGRQSPRWLLANGFSWDVTKEGYSFWYNIYNDLQA